MLVDAPDVTFFESCLRVVIFVMVPAGSPFFDFFVLISSVFSAESCLAHPYWDNFSAVEGFTQEALPEEDLIIFTRPSLQIICSAVKSNFICCLGLITSADALDVKGLVNSITDSKIVKRLADFITILFSHLYITEKIVNLDEN